MLSGASPRLVWWCGVLRSVACLAAYYAAAALLFGRTENWSTLDCVYYATVLMSTVGYGDLFPTKPETRFATVLFAMVGVLICFLQVAWIVQSVVSPMTKWMRDVLELRFPPAVVQVAGVDGSVLEVTVPRRRVPHYIQQLAPTMGVWVLLQLLFTALTCAAQPITFSLALYHVFITSLTIGLGDIEIDPEVARRLRRPRRPPASEDGGPSPACMLP